MATRPVDHGRASALPTALLAQAVPMLTKHELAALTERLIEQLDALDGDLDIEPNGDELDGTAGEDDFYPHRNSTAAPGCPVSDPDLAADDVPCDEPTQDLEPEEERDLHLDYRIDQSAGPLCPRLANDPALRRPHVERIRRELGVEKLRYPDYNGRTHRIPID